MSITKELKLKAVLDDSKIKKQIADLKKDLKSLGISSTSGGGFASIKKEIEKATKATRDFTAQVQKANDAAQDEYWKDLSKDIEKAKKEAEKLVKQKEALDKKYSGSYTDLTTGRVKKQQPASVARTKEFIAKQKAEDSATKKRQQEELKHVKFIEAEKDKAFKRRLKEAERRGPQGSYQEFANPQAALKERLMSKHGARLRQMRADEQAQQGGMGGFGRGLGGLGRMAGPLGFLAAGGIAFGQSMSNIRQIRGLRASRQQLQSLQEIEGQGAAGAIETSGREDRLTRLGGAAQGGAVGGLAGAAGGALAGAAIGSIVPVIGTAVGAAVGGTLGALGFGTMGAMSGAEEAGVEEGQTRLTETALGRAGLGKARAARRSVRALTRSGEMTESQINNATGLGAQYGITAEETLSDLQNASGSLGRRVGGQSITALQVMREQYGVDLGATAQAAETLGGFGGIGSQAGVGQANEMLKKAVSAGLDASKSGKFLQTTAEYVQNTAGFANVDVESIGNRLADLTSGFAGGKPATTADVQRAQQAQEMLQQESFGMQGLAGVGNFLGVQQALGEGATAEQVLAATGLSTNASMKDIQSALGVDEETAKRVREAKTNVTGTGIEALGLEQQSPLGLFLAQQQRGGPLESQLGLQKALTGRRDLEAAQPEIQTGTEAFKSLQQEAKRSSDVLKEGFGVLKTETELLSKRFNEFAQQLEKQSETTRRYINRTTQ